MWFVREIFRLVWMIAVALAVAAAVAGVWALLGPSGATGRSPAHAGFVHNFPITCFMFGALLLLLAGAGNRSTASARRTEWGTTAGGRTVFGVLSPPVTPRPGDPTLTASAVFVCSGLVLIVLGFLLY